MRIAAKCCFTVGGRKLPLEVFDEGGDVERLHLVELVQSMRRAPVSEAPGRIKVGLAGVVVVDLRREEFQHALRCLRRRRIERGWG